MFVGEVSLQPVIYLSFTQSLVLTQSLPISDDQESCW